MVLQPLDLNVIRNDTNASVRGPSKPPVTKRRPVTRSLGKIADKVVSTPQAIRKTNDTQTSSTSNAQSKKHGVTTKLNANHRLNTECHNTQQQNGQWVNNSALWDNQSIQQQPTSIAYSAYPPISPSRPTFTRIEQPLPPAHPMEPQILMRQEDSIAIYQGHADTSKRMISDVIDPEIRRDVRSIPLGDRTVSPSSVIVTRLGPFKPNDKEAAKDTSLTKCSKCKWYSRFNDYDTKQWCHACGRLSRTTTGEDQSLVPLSVVPSSEFKVGTKSISFQIYTRDPRLHKPYQKLWSQYGNSTSGWVYNAEELEDEFFLQQIGKHPTIQQILHNECDTHSLIFPNQNDRVLVGEMSRYQRGKRISWTLDADWDADERKGEITISLYLTDVAFHFNDFTADHYDSPYAYLLGSFFDVFPLQLSDLLTAPAKSEIDGDTAESSRSGDEQIDEKQRVFDAYNKKACDIRSQNHFLLSDGSHGGGRIYDSDCSFAGMLTRYFREKLTQDVKVNEERRLNTLNSFGPYLDERDHDLLTTDLRYIVEETYDRHSSLNGLLQELESLGHSHPDTVVEGLNVALFDFQKETLAWMMEHEMNGIESYLWSKVPLSSLYFSPVLNQFSKNPPKVVRGGLLSDEIGLGKTVVSLAMILKNTAPPFPESGSLMSSWISTSATDNVVPNYSDINESWSIDLTDPVLQNKSRGSRGNVFSRGTLVVCNVNLVGQWVKEAKSKLSDPSLIYCYHGANRDRSAITLSKNAIVVTTYNILGSDAFGHKKKSLDASYCPPCEQIRWWRVIFDDSHSVLNVSSKKYKAISRLSASHKWCVTGTPLNTSLSDLKNLMNVIGLKPTDRLFDLFQSQMNSKMFSSDKRNAVERQTAVSRAGNFLFVMRNVMIRHAAKQQSLHSNTDLMYLPTKEEETVFIDFSETEDETMKKIEKSAIEFYKSVRGDGTSAKVNSNYITLHSKLSELRAACSTGYISLTDSTKDIPPQVLSNVEINNDEHSITTQEKASDSEGGKTNETPSFLFKSKFIRLLQELTSIRDIEPQAKSVIYSHFSSTLGWLEKQLCMHGFNIRTLQGDLEERAKSLQDFESDPSGTIFLLNIRQGSVGINLSKANRVFLMEPALNPIQETQAIGRVYRYGQRNSVKVMKLCMNDSVETRLLNVLAKKYNSTDADSASDDAMASPVMQSSNNKGLMIGHANEHHGHKSFVKAEFDELFGLTMK